LSISKEERKDNDADAKGLSLEKLMKQLPLPSPEYAHELKMEKRVKQLLKEQEKKQ
jgi:hypothetical protein